MQTPQPGIYRHYKGNDYHLLEIATRSETGERVAVYRPQYGERALWVRPLAMWDETVDVDGQAVPRFRFLHPAEEDAL